MTLASRKALVGLRCAVVVLCESFLLVASAQAQQNPSATASSAANAAGTTVNNQSNAQINTNTFYGFGPGINCPTPTLSVSGFAGGGSGSSAGSAVGADVNSGNYGGILTYAMPIGGSESRQVVEIPWGLSPGVAGADRPLR